MSLITKIEHVFPLLELTYEVSQGAFDTLCVSCPSEGVHNYSIHIREGAVRAGVL